MPALRHSATSLLVLVLALLLAACGTTGTTTPSSPTERPASATATSKTAKATATTQAAIPAELPDTATEVALMDRVVDGDTISVIIDGRKETVRLIGMDTPETKKPNSPIECYGKEASNRTTELLPKGRLVWLERDVSERDRYERLLRYVWIQQPDGSVAMVNMLLVQEGYASSATYLPDVRYQADLTAAARTAREQGLGLWAACGGVDTPAEATVAPQSTAVPVGSTVESGSGAIGGNCDPSYPTVCIPPAPPDLDCGQIEFRRFEVLQPDPHHFDLDFDGIGCES